MPLTNKPQFRIIALCGYPNSGKTTVQHMLHDHGYQSIDDAAPLRRAAEALYGLPIGITDTQEGKASRVKIGNKEYCVRDLIGSMGEAGVRLHGPSFKIDRIIPYLNPTQYYTMGSCRGEEAKYWKHHGANIIEIQRPNIPIPLHARDRYNPDYIDYTIHNNTDLSTLRQQVANIVQHIRTSTPK